MKQDEAKSELISGSFEDFQSSYTNYKIAKQIYFFTSKRLLIKKEVLITSKIEKHYLVLKIKKILF